MKTEKEIEEAIAQLEPDAMLGTIIELLDRGILNGTPDEWTGTNAELFNALQETLSRWGKGCYRGVQTPDSVGRWLNQEADRLEHSFGIVVGKKVRTRDGDSRASKRLIYRASKVTAMGELPR